MGMKTSVTVLESLENIHSWMAACEKCLWLKIIELNPSLLKTICCVLKRT